MKHSTAAILAATVFGVATLAAVVLLLLFGSTNVQSMIEQALIGFGGFMATTGFAWLANRLRKDENQDGIPDILQGGIAGSRATKAENEGPDNVSQR